MIEPFRRIVVGRAWAFKRDTVKRKGDTIAREVKGSVQLFKLERNDVWCTQSVVFSLLGRG